jgi:hypothetical protein
MATSVEDGGPIRNQAEEEEYFLHLRGAASNPEVVSWRSLCAAAIT